MTNWINSLWRKHKAMTVVGAAVLLVAGWTLTPWPRGFAAARWDLAKGRHILLVYGLPGLGSDNYWRLLRKRYGLEERRVAGCGAPWSLIEYANGYDAASEAAAKRKFGRDIVEITFKDALKEWWRQNPDAFTQK